MVEAQKERKRPRGAVIAAWVFVVLPSGYLVAWQIVRPGLWPSGELWWSWSALVTAVLALLAVVFGVWAWRSNWRAAAVTPIILATPVILLFGWGANASFDWGRVTDISPAPILSVWETIGCQEGVDSPTKGFISTRIEAPPLERWGECTPYDGGEPATFLQFETRADAIAFLDMDNPDLVAEDDDTFIDGRVVIVATDPITAQKFAELFTAYD